MPAPTPRKRKLAVPQIERSIKTSLTLGVDLATKLAAAAAMRGCSQNAIVVEALTEALGGIVVFDRRKNAGPVRIDGSAIRGLGVTESDEDAA